MHHQHVPTTELLQYACQFHRQISLEYAHYLVLCARRVSKRAQQIEERAYAEFTPHWSSVFHRAVMIRRKHEAYTKFLHTVRHLLRRMIYIDAKLFQNISTAAGAGN